MSSPEVPRYPLVIVDTTPDEVDAMIGRLTLLGAEGIEERDATTLTKGAGAAGVTLAANFTSFDEARAAIASLGTEHARLEEIVGDDWRDAWRAHWKPTRIGTSLVIVPSWMSYDPAPGDRVMRLDPGRAFGTGQHASTALAVELMEECMASVGDDPVVDVGCGSGILGFAALLLGASRVVGCDTDADAVASADENAALLGLSDRATFRTGTLAVLPERSTLVLANIEAGVLIPLAADLASHVKPGGSLILSGILAAQLESIREAYEPHGLVLRHTRTREGWVSPRFERPA